MSNSQEEVCNCSQLIGSCLDLATPTNAKLSAFYKRSFAHHTVKSRMPVILTKLIDRLVRNKQQIADDYGMESVAELKAVIGEISKLKHEIQTNKQIPNLELHKPDAKIYNLFIKKSMDVNCKCSYYNTLWLFAECYMYRRIYDIFLNTTLLNKYDYFAKSKEESFADALPFITTLAKTQLELTTSKNSCDREIFKPDFIKLLKLNLWSNKCDLSITNGDISSVNNCVLDNIQSLDENILCDESDAIYAALCRNTMYEIVDFVLDNAGLELFTDFCLADFIITHNFAKTVRFFVKDFPWFISDTTKCDVGLMIEKLNDSADANMNALGHKWAHYIDSKVWIVEESNFWTTYVPYCEMYDTDEQLFIKLSRSKCTFYKGDLNYRKLLGDRNWDSTTPFENALEGFHPSRLCALRTLKADLICGLQPGVADEMEKKDPEWLVSGNYGVIQYCDKVKKLL